MLKSFRTAAVAAALAVTASFAMADVGLETNTNGYTVSGTGTFQQVTSGYVDLADLFSDPSLASSNYSFAPAVGTGFGELVAGADTTVTTLTYTFSTPTANADYLFLRLVSADNGANGFPDDLLTLTAYDQTGAVSYTRSYTTSSFQALVGGAYPDTGWISFEVGAGTSSFTITLANADDGVSSPALYVDYYATPTVITAAVPEASSSALALAGLGVVGAIARRRKSKQA